jgi:hypothetical protein
MILQRLSHGQLENQRQAARDVLDAVDRRDVRMIERGEHPCLAFQASALVGVSGGCGREDLDRDVAP